MMCPHMEQRSKLEHLAKGGPLFGVPRGRVRIGLVAWQTACHGLKQFYVNTGAEQPWVERERSARVQVGHAANRGCQSSWLSFRGRFVAKRAYYGGAGLRCCGIEIGCATLKTLKLA